MYIIINLEELRVVAKHRSVAVLADLAWVELQDISHSICPICYTSFAKLTDAELATLYANICGEARREMGRGQSLKLIVDALNLAPVTDIKPAEVASQAERVKEGDTGFHYVKGATRPSREAEALWLPPVAVSKEVEDLAKGAQVPKPPKPKVEVEPTKPEPGKAPPPVVKRQRNSNVKETVWRVADELWEAAGKPLDKSQVLTVRKQAMDVLEKEHDIKRTTASSTLGGWHKERAPF